MLHHHANGTCLFPAQLSYNINNTVLNSVRCWAKVKWPLCTFWLKSLCTFSKVEGFSRSFDSAMQLSQNQERRTSCSVVGSRGYVALRPHPRCSGRAGCVSARSVLPAVCLQEERPGVILGKPPRSLGVNAQQSDLYREVTSCEEVGGIANAFPSAARWEASFRAAPA